LRGCDRVDLALGATHGERVGWVGAAFETLPGDDACEFGVIGVAVGELGGVAREVGGVERGLVDAELAAMRSTRAPAMPNSANSARAA
jgi:hypothetical protein